MKKIVVLFFIQLGLVFFTNYAQAVDHNNERHWSISLPSATLIKLLPEITEQTGLQFSYETKVLQENNEKQSAIEGSFTVNELMQKLLAGSTLQYIYDSDKTIVLRLRSDFLNDYKPTIRPVSEVVVLGRYGLSKQEKLESPNTITSVQTDYLPRAGLANSSLLNIPSLWIDSSRSSIRVERASRNIGFAGAYEDGLPMLFNNPFYFENLDEYLRIDESVERIEIRQGGNAAVIQENGLGTVLGLVGKYDIPTYEPRNIIKLTAADDGLRRADVFYNSEINEKWDFYTSAFYFDSYELQGIGIDAIEGEGNQITLGVRRKWNRGTYTLKLRNIDDVGPVVVQTDDFLLNAYDGVNIKQNYLSTGLDLELGDDWILWYRFSKTKAKLDTDNLNISVSNTNQLASSLSINKPIDYLVQDLRFVWNGEAHNVTLGAFYSEQQSDNFKIEQVNSPVYTGFDYKLSNTALYYIDSWQLGDHWRLDMGLRAVEINYRYNNRYMMLVPGPIFPLLVPGVNAAKKRFRETNYTLGFNYALSDNAALVANISKNFRKISVDALLFSDQLPEPENYRALELGYRRFADNLDVSATFFKTKSEKDGVMHNLSFFNVISEISRPENSSNGFDAECNWRPNGVFELLIYAGIYRGKFPLDTTNIAVVEDELRQVRVTPQLQYAWGNVYLNYRFLEQDLNYGDGHNNTSDSTIVDLGVRIDLSDNITLHLVGRNLTDEAGVNSRYNAASQTSESSAFIPFIRSRSLSANLSFYFD